MEKTFDRILRLYKKYNVEAQERFSQNFLIDDRKIVELVKSLPLEEIDEIIEIGPGLGSLTEELIKTKKKITAIDVDRDMIRVLKEEYKDVENIEFIQENFLTTDLNVFHVKQKSYIGNLPYSITTKLIKTIITDDYFVSFNFMVQKDIVPKLIYKEGAVSNNPLSIILALRGKVSVVSELTPGMFYPSPKVYSSFLRFDLNDVTYGERDLELLEKIFRNPRKNLMNNLKASASKIGANDLERLGIAPGKRAHELTLEEIKKIISLEDIYNLK